MGVPAVKDAQNLFLDITGYDYYDKTSLPVFSATKPKPHHIDREDFDHLPDTFDFDWKDSQVQKLIAESEKMQLVDSPVA